MKKVLFVLLALSALSARAEWVIVNVDENGRLFYIDPVTIEKTGDIRRAWVLENYRIAESGGILSTMLLDEFDCNELRGRAIQAVAYSGHMGTGNIVQHVRQLNSWTQYGPDTIGASVVRYVCSR